MQFEARALDAQRQQIRQLRLQALDAQDAKAQLRSQGLEPLVLQAVGEGQWRARSRPPVLLFVEDLQALLEAGLNVAEALDLLAEREPSADAQARLQRLRQALAEGQLLSAAFRAQAFPLLLVGVVRAAESTGDVPQALARYAAYERRLEGVRQQVLSAITYPAILLAAGLGVSLFLLAYVVPRFAAVYGSTGRPMPWASQLLLGWGQWAGAHGAELVLGLLALTVLGFAWLRRLVRQGGWLRLLVLLPGVRARLQVLAQSRLYLTLGMLLEGGLPVAQALQLMEEAGDGEMRPRLAAVHAAVLLGQPLSQALRQADLGSTVGLRLVGVGERTGQLGALLTRAARFHEGEVARWMERFAKVLEPALMLGMGLVIGGIVVLLYLPVFELAGSLQ